MDKFEIKRHTFKDRLDPVSVYISCTTSEVNPLEIEKDVNDFVNFIKEKYRIPEEVKKLTFKEWLKNKLGCNG